jgi:hypothetical protein
MKVVPNRHRLRSHRTRSYGDRMVDAIRSAVPLDLDVYESMSHKPRFGANS